MNNTAAYRNYGHYVTDQWKDRKPKDIFTCVLDQLTDVDPSASVLDIGCATGEFLYFLSQRYPDMRLTGADVFDALLDRAREHQPHIDFINASALDLPSVTQYDVVTAIGVMSIFDETQIESFWDNLLKVTKPGGRLLVFSPLNEYGVDAMIRHRKHIDGQSGNWETGWNIFARDTIVDILAARSQTLKTIPFNISFDLPKQDDPIRTWTMNTEHKQRQLTNGLKLLVDHQLMIVDKQ